MWRDGQKKRVFVYRFLASGTIEEKVRSPRHTPASPFLPQCVTAACLQDSMSLHHNFELHLQCLRS